MNKLYLNKNIAYILPIVIFPSSLLLKYFNASSMQSGTMLSLLIIIFMAFFFKINNYIRKNELVFIGILLTFTIVSSNFLIFYDNNFNIQKYVFSIIYFPIFIYGAYMLANIIGSLNTIHIVKALDIIFYIVLLDGFISTILYQLGIGDRKGLFLFQEPSHFALTFLPLLMFKLSIKYNYIYLFLSFYIALFFQNLTLLIGLVLVLYTLSRKNVIIIMAILAFIGFIAYNFYDFSYFLNRVDLSSENDNLSTLVFMSGWERAYENFFATNGLGIGLQQLGYTGYLGAYQEILYRLMDNSYLNLYDGGTTASKIISEEGIIGVILIVLYLWYFLRYIGMYKKYSRLFTSIEVFSFSVYILFSIELFIRGSGYFTGTSLLFLSSLFYLLKRENVSSSVFYKEHNYKRKESKNENNL
jgi:hypothetical protein